MRTAVLIHGCHLQAEGWEDIVWGKPRENILGRVPKGLLEAVKWDADMVIFSTGASEKDGLKEGEYTLLYALKHVEELRELIGWEGDLRAWLTDLAELELTSQNTCEEVLASARMARSDKIERLLIVTSPSHVMRAHQEAISALGSDPELKYFLGNLYATASDTCYAGTKIEDVAIFEPPHRGDRPKTDLHKHIRNTRRVPAENMPAFITDMNALVKKHGG